MASIPNYQQFHKALMSSISKRDTMRRLINKTTNKPYISTSKSGSGHAMRVFDRCIQTYKLNTDHFPDIRDVIGANSRQQKQNNKKTDEQIFIIHNKKTFVVNGRRKNIQRIRQRLSQINPPNLCSQCNNGIIWNGKRLVLQMDHIDGHPWNNKIQNLRWLCPNCHSQQSTTAIGYKKNRNIKSKDLYDMYLSGLTYRQISIKLNKSMSIAGVAKRIAKFCKQNDLKLRQFYPINTIKGNTI